MKWILGLSLIFVSNLSWAQTKGDMDPLPEEKLPIAINLSDSCSNVSIVEWKSTPGFESSSEISDRAIAILDKICQKAVNHFIPFVKFHGYQVENDDTYRVSVSLLPARLDRSGTDYRNLNDLVFRFANRSKEYDEDGTVYPIWGYFQRSTFNIYVRNDILDDRGERLNLKFRTVFAHELFHSLSYHYKVFHQHKGNKDFVEEKMAGDYTMYLGYNR